MTYRDQPLLCPSCATRMDERAAETAHIDECPKCRGVWIEWFDGEIPAIAAQIPPPSTPGATPPLGARACPTCQRHLDDELLLGVRVGRCGECAGAFVTREALAEIASRASHAPPEPEKNEESSPGLAQRLLALVRELFAS